MRIVRQSRVAGQQPVPKPKRRAGVRLFLFFCFFLFSGFCSLVYQVVWLRMAMADFGVTTAQVSIVLSVFMAGLALGSWGGGKLVQRFSARSVGFVIRLYALSEVARRSVGSEAVAPLLHAGRELLNVQAGHAWGSSGCYLWLRAGGSRLVMLPFCCCTGRNVSAGHGRDQIATGIALDFQLLVSRQRVGERQPARLAPAFVFIELAGSFENSSGGGGSEHAGGALRARVGEK